MSTNLEDDGGDWLVGWVAKGERRALVHALLALGVELECASEACRYRYEGEGAGRKVFEPQGARQLGVYQRVGGLDWRPENLYLAHWACRQAEIATAEGRRPPPRRTIMAFMDLNILAQEWIRMEHGEADPDSFWAWNREASRWERAEVLR